ncbi:MAG: hypothetical protein H7062_10275 [Candidatus Saccharimonas sp.]|nr:hypothetical protein [Planctomycetaceae bacterium]
MKTTLKQKEFAQADKVSTTDSTALPAGSHEEQLLHREDDARLGAMNNACARCDPACFAVEARHDCDELDGVFDVVRGVGGWQASGCEQGTGKARDPKGETVSGPRPSASRHHNLLQRVSLITLSYRRHEIVDHVHGRLAAIVRIATEHKTPQARYFFFNAATVS